MALSTSLGFAVLFAPGGLGVREGILLAILNSQPGISASGRRGRNGPFPGRLVCGRTCRLDGAVHDDSPDWARSFWGTICEEQGKFEKTE